MSSYLYAMVVDCIIIGLGLAGISFCEQLENHGKSYVVVSDNSEQASLVAGGLYNPVILKRFTLAWKADEQMKLALPFYASLEKKLKVKLDYKVPVYRRFTSIEEQNSWFEASDKMGLKNFLSIKIVANQNDFIDAPFGMGEVLYTGRVDTKKMIDEYSRHLLKKGVLRQENFNFHRLNFENDGIQYEDITAKRVVFAEGFGLKKNPFFNYLPLNGTKGELLTIHAPSLKENSVIKSSVFVIPLEDDLYRIGATYKWKDTTSIPTEASKKELLEKLKTFIKCDFKVVNHVAGIRPTVADRRPLIGRHPRQKNVFVLNGFGSRGVLIAPFAAQQLYGCMAHGDEIDPAMNIKRFENKYG